MRGLSWRTGIRPENKALLGSDSPTIIDIQLIPVPQSVIFMPIIAIIAIVGVVILVIYALLNKTISDTEREGIIKDVLNKDAVLVDFGDGRNTIVKIFGIVPASDNEMLDEKIFEFYDASIRGISVKFRQKSIATGDILVGELYSMAGEYINAAIVRHGFARWSASEAGSDQALLEAQELAKREQVGLWNPAIRQLMEEKMRQQASGEMSDDDIANLSVDPEQEETKESRDSE